MKVSQLDDVDKKNAEKDEMDKREEQDEKQDGTKDKKDEYRTKQTLKRDTGSLDGRTNISVCLLDLPWSCLCPALILLARLVLLPNLLLVFLLLLACLILLLLFLLIHIILLADFDSALLATSVDDFWGYEDAWPNSKCHFNLDTHDRVRRACIWRWLAGSSRQSVKNRRALSYLWFEQLQSQQITMRRLFHLTTVFDEVYRNCHNHSTDLCKDLQ